VIGSWLMQAVCRLAMLWATKPWCITDGHILRSWPGHEFAMMKQEDQLLFFFAFSIGLESVCHPDSPLYIAYVSIVNVVGRILTCDTLMKQQALVMPTRNAVRLGGFLRL